MKGFKAAKTWLFSALRPRVREAGEHIAAVRAALNRVVTGNFLPSDCHSCLQQMLLVEQRKLNRHSYRYPFYFWRRQLDAREKALVKESWEQAFEGTAALPDRIAILGLAARVAPLNKQLEKAMSALVLDATHELDIALSIDLCGLLHSQRRYKDLLAVAQALLERAGEMSVHEANLLCDFYFQAAYQLIKIKIFRNNISAEDVDQLRSIYERCCSVLGRENGNIHNYRGLLACVEGDLDGAVGYHLEARKWPAYNTQFFCAALNMVSVAEMRRLADVAPCAYDGIPDFYGDIRMNFRHVPGGDATLIACDERYFNSFARGFCESFGLQNPGAILHVHAIGFEPAEETLQELERDFTIAINVTIDPGPASAGLGDLFRGYCAGSRYIHLPRYQEHYRRIIVNDIDGIVHTGMAEIWAGRNGQVLLSTPVLDVNRKGHFAFWSNIGAGAFAIEDIDSHKRFSVALANYLTMRFNACREKEERFFFSDQVGLLLGVLAFRDDVAMAEMPQLFRQSSQTSQISRDDAKKNSQSAMLKKMAATMDKAPKR